MVWLMPLRACVHVTHGTWLNDSFRVMCQVRVKDMCQVVRKEGKWGGGGGGGGGGGVSPL